MPYKNLEDKKAHNQRYYELNKETLNANKQKNERCISCNKWFQTGYLKKHLKTKKHANKVAELIRQQS
jgi:hypothetical protein